MSDARRAWLVKTEPETFSFADLWRSPQRTSPWEGVRNYQARNYLRDEMRPGDPVLVYHSSADPPGVAGLAEVAGEGSPDPSQVDPGSVYFDPKSLRGDPRWWLVDVRAVRALDRFVPLAELRADAALARLDLPLLRRGNRLSVMPVSGAALARILELSER